MLFGGKVESCILGDIFFLDGRDFNCPIYC